MDDNQSRSDLDQRLARLVDGDATADDIAALEKILDGNPDAQRRYVHYLDLHQELLARGCDGEIDGSRQEQSSLDSSDTNSSNVSRINVAALFTCAAALLLAVGLGIGRWTNPTRSDGALVRNGQNVLDPDLEIEESDDGVAVLYRAVDVQWLSDDPPHTGGVLSPSELKLSDGLIQLEFYNGVQLLVEGPAELEIRSVASVVCRRGKLRSLVPPNATGFSVLTPKFELVDLGTEFAVDVASDGRSDVHVFDGEVELYLPDGKRKPDHKQVLLGGDAMAWSTEGTKTSREASPEAFTSFESIRVQEQSATEQRFKDWQQWNETLRNDPRVVARYDFQSQGSTLLESSSAKANGTIIGCEWTSGRWPEKRALEFKRPGDRVRVQIPGEYDSLTLSAWVRLDALPPRRQALLLADANEVGRLHWQIGPKGELRISSRIQPQEDQTRSQKIRHKGYGSPRLFVPKRVGVWNCVCTTYDRKSQTITQWFNGRQVGTHRLTTDQPIRIGFAEIGNWAITDKPGLRAVRNFVGRMDELTIWNTALDEQEIADLYRRSLP